MEQEKLYDIICNEIMILDRVNYGTRRNIS